MICNNLWSWTISDVYSSTSLPKGWAVTVKTQSFFIKQTLKLNTGLPGCYNKGIIQVLWNELKVDSDKTCNAMGVTWPVIAFLSNPSQPAEYFIYILFCCVCKTLDLPFIICSSKLRSKRELLKPSHSKILKTLN